MEKNKVWLILKTKTKKSKVAFLLSKISWDGSEEHQEGLLIEKHFFFKINFSSCFLVSINYTTLLFCPNLLNLIHLMIAFSNRANLLKMWPCCLQLDVTFYEAQLCAQKSVSASTVVQYFVQTSQNADNCHQLRLCIFKPPTLCFLYLKGRYQNTFQTHKAASEWGARGNLKVTQLLAPDKKSD